VSGEPTRPHIDEELRGLGGWLSLVGFGLCVTCVWSLFESLLYVDPYAGIVFLLCIPALYAFFTKRRYFPKLGIVVVASSIPEALALVILDPDHRNIQYLLRSSITAAVWVPYFLRSRRVKFTFVR
jgi:Protein of unknown function (DUF2569)